MARLSIHDRIIEPIFVVKGFKGQVYLLCRYVLFWMEQRIAYIALRRSQRCIKLIFLLFNSFTMICAITVLVLSLEKDEFDEILAGVTLEGAGTAARNQDALTIMTLTSVIMTCIYGYWFILKENRTQIMNVRCTHHLQVTLLVKFIVLCAISLIFNMVLLIIQLIGTAELYLGSVLYPLKQIPETSSRLDIPQFWNELQAGGKCCGFEGAHDWKSRIPLSCCPNDVFKISNLRFYNEDIFRSEAKMCNISTAYKRGCKFVFHKKIIWPAVVFSTMITEVFALLAACFYYFAVKVTRGYQVDTIHIFNPGQP